MIEFTGKDTDEYELRLVDLLASIIRNRWWVLWATIIGTVLAVSVLFILPAVGFNLLSEETITLQAEVRVISIPAEAQSVISFDMAANIQAQRSNLHVVADLYRSTLMTSHDAALTKPAFNRLVRQLVDKSFRVVADSSSSTVVLTLKVKEQDQDRGVQFLQQFLADSRATLSLYAKTKIQQAIANLETSSKPRSELAMQSLARYELIGKALKGVLADPDFPFAPTGSIEAMQDEPGQSKGILLALWVLGSVFVGVLAALAADAIRRTRQDTATVELLKKAWRRE